MNEPVMASLLRQFADDRRICRRRFSLAALVLGFVSATGGMADSDPRTGQTVKNGFDLSSASVPVCEIVKGGPPRDGIPAISEPEFVHPYDSILQDEDLVISFKHQRTVRAYPLRILLWHEIVNDQIGGKPITVTYCPLCGTSMVFDATVDGRHLDFGTSGLLFNSDVLLYDRETESLWSQLGLKCISGRMVGTSLIWLPSEIVTFGVWKAQNSKFTLEVLSTETGFVRNYSYNPYQPYQQSQQVWFNVPVNRDEFLPKTWILGILIEGRARAYPVKSLGIRQSILDRFKNRPLQLDFNAHTGQASVVDAATGETLPSVLSYWFAWQAFYPETEVWRPAFGKVGSQIHFTIEATPGDDYLVEFSEDLENWSVVDAVPEASGLVDLLAEPRENQGFFRIRPMPIEDKTDGLEN